MKINIKKNYGSHLPVLIKVMNETSGSVLELGTGLYSTPYLHWACFSQKRKLVSYDSKEYIDLAASYKDTFHEVYGIDDFSKIDIEKTWDVALVDHTPAERRKEEVKRLAFFANYIIIHDSEHWYDKDYKYSEIYPLFTYRFDYKEAWPHTTVLSNFVDLTNFKV
jgi:hypothetical protein